MNKKNNNKKVKLGFTEQCTECGQLIPIGNYAIAEYGQDYCHGKVVTYSHIDDCPVDEDLIWNPRQYIRLN